MREADRLFSLLDHLRRDGPLDAAALAERLALPETDVRAAVARLRRCGVAVDDDPARGYRLRHDDVPRLLFDRDRLLSLQFGARLVDLWDDPELAWAAGYALSKADSGVGAPPDATLEQTLKTLREAIGDRHRVRFAYRADADRAGAAPQPVGCRPLGLLCWGAAWTLVAWDEQRRDFGHYRADRIDALGVDVAAGPFAEVPGQTLDDFMQILSTDR